MEGWIMGDIRTSSLGEIPKGNTSSRPSSPIIGDVFYNGQLEILEIWNGSAWVAVSAPPSTPQIVSVTDASSTDPYTATGGKLEVVLQAGSGGGTPSQYNVYTTSGGHSAISNTTTAILTGLTPGTSYIVYANGQNNFGTTVNTPNAASVTPTTLPEVRTIGTATASGSSNEVTVTWTNGNNGGTALTAITITPYLNGVTAETSRTALTTSSTSYTFTNGQLTLGASYTFKVSATNINGTCENSNASNSVTVPNFFFIDYLVIAGGGAGSANFGNGNGSGGGGAGGYRVGTNFGVPKNGFTVTVGAGGTGQSGTTYSNRGSISAQAPSGSNSVLGIITSAGGGGGAAPGGPNQGASGGSGGGGTADGMSGGTGNTPSVSPSQGNNGGAGSFGEPYRGGGGGGAGSSGVDGETNGNGGNGVSSSITGTTVTLAGGGGGGTFTSYAAGTGGTGGGGAGGGTSLTNGGNGTVNTGSGGGGGVWPGPSESIGGNGGSGGSGVVVIKWLTSSGTINVGAGLVADATGTDGSYSYKRFTAGSGNVSFS
jgi:hypothetical protein